MFEHLSADEVFLAATLVMRHGPATARESLGACHPLLRAELGFLRGEHAKGWKETPDRVRLDESGPIIRDGSHERYHLSHCELAALDLGGRRYRLGALEDAALRKYGCARDVVSRKERDRRERRARLETWMRRSGTTEPTDTNERRAWSIACKAYVDHGLGRVQRIPHRYRCWLEYDRLSDFDRWLLDLSMPCSKQIRDGDIVHRTCTMTPPSRQCTESLIRTRKDRFEWLVSLNAEFATASVGQAVDYILSGRNQNVIVEQVDRERTLRAELDRLECPELLHDRPIECLAFVLFGDDAHTSEFVAALLHAGDFRVS